MSTPSDKLTKAAESVAAEIGKVKVWYKQYTLYVGLIVGAVGALIVRHFI